MIGLLFPAEDEVTTLVIGGISILARQARQLRQAGATQLLIVDPEPLSEVPEGAEPISRAALAQRVSPDVPVLAIAPGLIIDERAITLVAGAAAPALLVSLATPADVATAAPGTAPPGIERLDADTLAAGVMLVQGSLLRDVLGGLGEWDLASTLLRTVATDSRTTRLNFARITLYSASRRRDVPLLWSRPTTPAEAAATTDELIAAAQKGVLDWPARFLHPLVEDPLVRLLAPTRITPNMVTLFGGVIGIGAGIALATGMLWLGLGLALLAGPLDGVDGKLARTRLEFSRWGDLEHVLDKILEYGWYFCAAWCFSGVSGSALPWAIAWLIALPALVEAVQGEFFRRMTGRQLDDAGPVERRIRLIAGRRNTFLWTWAGFAAAGFWFEGFVALAVYSVVTTAVAQWRFYVRLLAYARDHGDRIAANYAATDYAFLPEAKL